MRILRVLEKLFALVVVAPPLYMAFRYMRWFFRQHNEEQAESEA